MIISSSITIWIFIFGSWITFLISPLLARSVSDCNCVCGTHGRENRIVGGSVTDPNQYPWLAGLDRNGKIFCGATVISNRFLITAAHCVNGLDTYDIRIFLGGHRILKDYTEIRRIKEIYEHQKFDIISFDNDIALIEMDKPIRFGPKLQPVCMPDTLRESYFGEIATVAGWGNTEERGKTSDITRSVNIPLWSAKQCNDAGYGYGRLTDNMMCGGYHDGGRDACQGDSGGPLILPGPTGSAELIGIVSWGRGCARPNLPGIYTRVVNYLPWIEQTIAGECLCQPKVGERSHLIDRLIN